MKGSRSRARFSTIFRPKCRIRREWRAKAQPSGAQERPEPARQGHGLEKDGTFFCCEHCAEVIGVTGLRDRISAAA